MKHVSGIVERTWAYPAPEPEAELGRIEFRGSLGSTDESLRIERHRIAIRAWVVEEAPIWRNGGNVSYYLVRHQYRLSTPTRHLGYRSCP
jgi:hypothetical protein